MVKQKFNDKNTTPVTLKELHITDDELSEILDFAEENAKSDWENRFTSDIAKRFEIYGGNILLSPRQLAFLYDISRST